MSCIVIYHDHKQILKGFDFSTCESVLDLKHLIKKEYGYTIDCQILSFENNLVPDTMTLAEFNVQSSDRKTTAGVAMRQSLEKNVAANGSAKITLNLDISNGKCELEINLVKGLNDNQ